MRTILSFIGSDLPFFMVMPAVLWQVIFFYIPLLCVLSLSFMVPDATAEWSWLGLHNYTYFMTPLFMQVIVRSLIMAFVTSCLCFLLAYPVAYCLAFKIRKSKNVLLFFLILPFWTSLMVQVYSWFFVLEHNGLINTVLLNVGIIGHSIPLLNTMFAVYTVMIYCYLPFMILPLYTILEKIDRRLLEASADLGASSWQTFIKVTLPLSMPGIKTGFFLVFVPSFGEFVVPALLGGGKYLFVGSLITQYFLVGRNPYKGAAFTLISGIALLLAVLVLYGFFARRIRLPNTRG